MSKEAMKLALEGAANYIDALGGDSRKYRQALASEAKEQPAPGRAHYEDGDVFERIAAIKKQPAQQQEPVAWIDPKHLEWLAQSPDNLTGAGLAARQRSADMAPLYTSPPAQPQQEPVAWPAGLIERIKAAEQRIQDGHAPRRIPADPTDVDLVLAEVRYLLEGKQPPFWLHTSPQPAQQQEPICYKHGDEPKQGCAWCDKQPAQPQQEPVAWGWAIMHSDGTYAWIRPRIVDFFGSIQEREPYTSDDTKHADREWAGLAPHTIVTLYTSPPAQPARKPLTREQVKDLLFEAGYVGAEESADFISGLRHGEAAHGIGGQS